MMEKTTLEDAYIELEGIGGFSQMGQLVLSQDEKGRIELSPRAQYELLEFLYKRRNALYRATHLRFGAEDVPEWIRSGYAATRIVDAPSLEPERKETDRWSQ